MGMICCCCNICLQSIVIFAKHKMVKSTAAMYTTPQNDYLSQAGENMKLITVILNWLDLFLFILLLRQFPSARRLSICIDTWPCQIWLKFVYFWQAFPVVPVCSSTLKDFFPHSSVQPVYFYWCLVPFLPAVCWPAPGCRWFLHSSALPPRSNLQFCAKCTEMPLGYCTAPNWNTFCIGKAEEILFSSDSSSESPGELQILTQIS